MIDKRLTAVVSGSMKYIIGNVIFQWCALLANIAMMTGITMFLADLFDGTAGQAAMLTTLAIALAAVLIRFVCAIGASRMSFLSSKAVKKILRQKIYEKLLRLGASYNEQTATSEIVQVSVEGVDQLETYFGAYLPQFFYAMLAPFTLFIYLCFVNVPSAIVLLVCVPLIPIAIALVQTWAKKLLGKYWGQYTALGDVFLENLQGLTTLKIYQADEFKQEEMNEEAEKFRKITMKVLTMQLNSITIMDFIAYGGAALGLIMAVTQYMAGHVTLSGCLLIILLSADFFIPMRQLGSYFHVAMNGMAASDKIFRLLDLPEPEQKSASCPENGSIVCHELSFSYGNTEKKEHGNAEEKKCEGTDEKESVSAGEKGCGNADEKEREVLHGVDLSIPWGSFISIVGESGCGKSTLASILMGRNRGYEGSVTVGGVELRELNETSLFQNITYVSHHSYLFKGTVRDNLLMGRPTASDEELWRILEQVNLADFVRSEKGLDTLLTEQGNNLSGGQRQRMALARALLHDSPVYIFDEATSNIDVESENEIMAQIHALAGKKTVILISHRLANVTGSDRIYVMDDGRVAESGTHKELLGQSGSYAALRNAQQSLENFGREAVLS
ncbi:MAG: ABC transporter ATP-binding protein/permease [Lachnospiraceae bacterium]|nr:ABC transporter ATP-binding protein/permease [Lachnospiraceae bacterium]